MLLQYYYVLSCLNNNSDVYWVLIKGVVTSTHLNKYSTQSTSISRHFSKQPKELTRNTKEIIILMECCNLWLQMNIIYRRGLVETSPLTFHPLASWIRTYQASTIISKSIQMMSIYNRLQCNFVVIRPCFF